MSARKIHICLVGLGVFHPTCAVVPHHGTQYEVRSKSAFKIAVDDWSSVRSATYSGVSRLGAPFHLMKIDGVLNPKPVQERNIRPRAGAPDDVSIRTSSPRASRRSSIEAQQQDGMISLAGGGDEDVGGRSPAPTATHPSPAAAAGRPAPASPRPRSPRQSRRSESDNRFVSQDSRGNDSPNPHADQILIPHDKIEDGAVLQVIKSSSQSVDESRLQYLQQPDAILKEARQLQYLKKLRDFIPDIQKEKVSCGSKEEEEEVGDDDGAPVPQDKTCVVYRELPKVDGSLVNKCHPGAVSFRVLFCLVNPMFVVKSGYLTFDENFRKAVGIIFCWVLPGVCVILLIWKTISEAQKRFNEADPDKDGTAYMDFIDSILFSKVIVFGLGWVVVQDIIVNMIIDCETAGETGRFDKLPRFGMMFTTIVGMVCKGIRSGLGLGKDNMGSMAVYFIGQEIMLLGVIYVFYYVFGYTGFNFRPESPASALAHTVGILMDHLCKTIFALIWFLIFAATYVTDAQKSEQGAAGRSAQLTGGSTSWINFLVDYIQKAVPPYMLALWLIVLHLGIDILQQIGTSRTGDFAGEISDKFKETNKIGCCFVVKSETVQQMDIVSKNWWTSRSAETVGKWASGFEKRSFEGLIMPYLDLQYTFSAYACPRNLSAKLNGAQMLKMRFAAMGVLGEGDTLTGGISGDQDVEGK